MLLLCGMKRVKAHKDKLCRGSAGSGPSLHTGDVTLVWDYGKQVKALRTRRSSGSGLSLETSVWDDEK